jgi:hypothetical protein
MEGASLSQGEAAHVVGIRTRIYIRTRSIYIRTRISNSRTRGSGGGRDVGSERMVAFLPTLLRESRTVLPRMLEL